MGQECVLNIIFAKNNGSKALHSNSGCFQADVNSIIDFIEIICQQKITLIVGT